MLSYHRDLSLGSQHVKWNLFAVALALFLASPGVWATATATATATAGANDPGVGAVIQQRGGARRGLPRGQRFPMLSEKSPCAVIKRRYVSSPLEQTWLKAAADWKADGNGEVKEITPFCQLLVDTMLQITKMLSYIKDIMASNTTLSTAPDADDVLSYFLVTQQCGPYRITHKEHIESLVGALRHPFSIACPPPFDTQIPAGYDIFDRSYVVLASWTGQVAATRNKYYLDAGAGIGYRANGNQHWMIETYAARGIELDRTIFWEAMAASAGSSPFDDVPSSLFPAFTFYNIPAPKELDDGRNPLNVATRLAKPEDFLSVKLDIDQPEIEDYWLRAILGPGPGQQAKSVYAELIDELFWEHHFNFKPMVDCCWASSIDSNSVLVDSMRLFVQFRELGIRSHYWQ